MTFVNTVVIKVIRPKDARIDKLIKRIKGWKQITTIEDDLGNT
jgi:hypothetical protein